MPNFNFQFSIFNFQIMRWSVYLLAVIITSCTTFSREKEQQSKIDSLANELKKRDSAIKKNVSVQEEVQKDTIVLAESSEINEENHVKEIGTKKKEQKNTVLADEKDHEAKKSDDVTDDIVKTDQPENYAAIDERNAVLKKVVADKASFKPLFLGGFKDIKFNFYNNYSYRLEEAILKVHYIREDGSEIKTETKILKDVAPGSRLALTAPDHTSGGKQIKITIEAVQCRAIDLCFYSSEPAKSIDPYRCR